ncbi:MAG: hypothetical protein HY350_04305 [Candidatus Omnitrophica bacterium]|nr:hypothetical protein [Candidatus Omnitrophota bacterium]
MLTKDELTRHIKESEDRLKIAYSFREPDRVPIIINEYGSYWARLFGSNIRDYYTDLEVMIDVQEKGLKWRFEDLRDDRNNYILNLEYGPVQEAIVFDCPLEYPDDTSPRIVPILKDIKDIENLKIIEPENNPRIKEFLKRFEEFKKIAEKRKSIFPVQQKPYLQIHPPLSAACAIMESVHVYTYLYTEPELIKVFFDKMLKAFFMLADYFDKINGTKTESIFLADDNSCSISGEMYMNSVVKYNRAIYERYGKQTRFLHADGPNDQLFPAIAEELNLTIMDIGGWSRLDEAVKYLKGKTVIHGGLNVKDLYYGLTPQTKSKIDNAIRLAAPGGGYQFAIGGETYPGVSADSLSELTKYVKEKGKYPIK